MGQGDGVCETVEIARKACRWGESDARSRSARVDLPQCNDVLHELRASWGEFIIKVRASWGEFIIKVRASWGEFIIKSPYFLQVLPISTP